MGTSKTYTNAKCDINVNIINIRTKYFGVGVSDDYLTYFINEVACKLKKVDQIPNRVSKSDTTTKQARRLKRSI